MLDKRASTRPTFGKPRMFPEPSNETDENRWTWDISIVVVGMIFCALSATHPTFDIQLLTIVKGSSG